MQMMGSYICRELLRFEIHDDIGTPKMAHLTTLRHPFAEVPLLSTGVSQCRQGKIHGCPNVVKSRIYGVFMQWNLVFTH